MKLCFLGDIDEFNKREITRLGLGEIVELEGKVSYEASLAKMQEVKALLLIEAMMEEGVFLPSKFCDYAVSGKPLLLFSPRKGAVADIVGHDHPGLLSQNEHEVFKGLKLFFKIYMSGKNMEKYLCPDAHHFTETKVVDKFVRCISTITPSRL